MACNPHADRRNPEHWFRYRACIESIICQRCGKCVVHCTCSPVEMRPVTDEVVRNRRGSLVLKPTKQPKKPATGTEVAARRHANAVKKGAKKAAAKKK